MNEHAENIINQIVPEAPRVKPLVYFDLNGGDYPWFLRETDGTESSYATLSEAVVAGLNVARGVDIRTMRQSLEHVQRIRDEALAKVSAELSDAAAFGLNVDPKKVLSGIRESLGEVA